MSGQCLPTLCGTFDTHRSPTGPSHGTWATSKGLPDHLTQSSPRRPCSQQSQVPRARGAPAGDSAQPLFSTGRQREPVNAIGVARALRQVPSASSLELCSVGTFSGPGQGSHGLWVSVVRALPERKPPEGAWHCVLEGSSCQPGREGR